MAVHKIKLLQTSADDDSICMLRLLVGRQHIRYATVDHDIFDCMDLIFEPTERQMGRQGTKKKRIEQRQKFSV